MPHAEPKTASHTATRLMNSRRYNTIKKTEIEQQIINHYMQFVTDVETIVDDRRILYRVGDRFAVEVTRCDHDLNNPHDMMRVWRKAGFIKTMLPTHIAVETYYYDINGNCWGLYNVTHKLSDDGHRRIINYLRE